MNTRRTSLIWTTPEEEFREVIKNAYSYSHALTYFRLKNKGGNWRTLKERIKYLNVSTSHFLPRLAASLKSRRLTKEDVLEKVLVENSKTSRNTVKRYLIQHALIDYKCECCGNDGEWMGQTLSLQLEHKNGVSDDNRLSNLGFLCPNCHSQTDTFAGKSSNKNGGGSRSRSDSATFKELSASLLHHSPKKHEEKNKIPYSPYKIIWPSPEDLQVMLWRQPTTWIAKDLGVSDQAINKFCKKHNLNKPPRGYWTKVNGRPQRNRTPIVSLEGSSPFH